MPIYEFEGKRPRIAATAYLHPEAVVIGDVEIGADCFIGPGVVLRADFGSIRVGAGTNIQDNCVVHGNETVIGPNGHIGHNAIIHGATLGEHVLVGMGAIILDEAQIGDGCIIGAGAVVAPRAVVPARKLVMGVPAAIVSDVSPEREAGTWAGTRNYQTLPRRYRASLRPLSWEEVVVKEGP